MPGEWRLQLLEGWFIFEMISAAGLNSPAWFTRPRTGGGIAQGERKLRFSKRRAVTLSPPLFSSFLFSPLPPPPLSVFSPPSARIKRAPWRWATERKQTSTAGKLYSTGKDPWTFSIKPSASLPPSLSLPLSTGSCQNHDNCWHTRAHTCTPITRPVSIIRAGWRANEQLNGNQTRPPNPWLYSNSFARRDPRWKVTR